MIVEQVKFRSNIDDDIVESKEEVVGGIAVYENNKKLQYVICGCCGGIFEPNECEIVEVLQWLPISDEIIGE